MSDITIVKGKKDEIDKEIFTEALRLRYKIYLEEGFLKENETEVDEDQFDNKATHFIALEGERVVGTLRLIEGKIPLEKIYLQEKKELIKINKSKRVVELSRFSVDEEYRIKNNEKKLISLRLIREALSYIKNRDLDLLLIVVHPRYQERYEKYYGLTKYGEEKPYSEVEGNPAVLMYITGKNMNEFLNKLNKILK